MLSVQVRAEAEQAFQARGKLASTLKCGRGSGEKRSKAASSNPSETGRRPLRQTSLPLSHGAWALLAGRLALFIAGAPPPPPLVRAEQGGRAGDCKLPLQPYWGLNGGSEGRLWHLCNAAVTHILSTTSLDKGKESTLT